MDRSGYVQLVLKALKLLFSGTNQISERINAMCLDIAGGWLTRVPDVILHEHAVQTVIAAPKPTWMNHPPSPVCDDLPNTNTLVLERSRKLVIVRVKAG